MQVDIISAGECGAYEFHKRFDVVEFSFDKAQRTLRLKSLEWANNQILEFVAIQIDTISTYEIVLEGIEPIGSGQGVLPQVRKIILKLK